MLQAHLMYFLPDPLPQPRISYLSRSPGCSDWSRGWALGVQMVLGVLTPGPSQPAEPGQMGGTSPSVYACVGKYLYLYLAKPEFTLPPPPLTQHQPPVTPASTSASSLSSLSILHPRHLFYNSSLVLN